MAFPEYPGDIKVAADNEQVLKLNPTAAIQKALAAFNNKHSDRMYQLVTREVPVEIEYEGKRMMVIAQKAEDIGGGIPLYFATPINIWKPVFVTDGILEFVEWDKYTFPQA